MATLVVYGHYLAWLVCPCPMLVGNYSEYHFSVLIGSALCFQDMWFVRDPLSPSCLEVDM